MLWARASLAVITSSLLLPFDAASQELPVFINEIHYDNAGGDLDEAVELAAHAGSDLAGWSLALYNGKNGSVYATISLEGRVPDAGNGWGTLSFSAAALQNGAPDGIAVVDPLGRTVQFLSYEGRFAAVDGPAAKLQSRDIGSAESGTTPPRYSLQLVGIGSGYESFHWSSPQPSSFGSINPGQSFGAAIPRHPIAALQGAGHRSPFEGTLVESSGVVTWVEDHGFFLQDAEGDGDPRTSEALFVYTGDAPAQKVGNRVTVRGQVSEYVPGGAQTHNLSTTELRSFEIETHAEGAPLPAAVVLGSAGRLPPTEVIDDDGLTSFDPEQDGIDFYEALEAMRIALPELRILAPRTSFRELWGVVPGEESASGVNRNGGITLRPGDANPERLQIQLPPGATLSSPPTVGDTVTGMTGVLSYGFGNFELLPTEAFSFTPGLLVRPRTTLYRGGKSLTVASFNLRNLSPGDPERMQELASQIVHHLATPDLIGVQEIQDNDGAEDSGEVSAALTAAALIAAIEGAGGPTYAYLDRPPVDGRDGGEPGGNIRVAFLYDPNRVVLDRSSVEQITDRQPTDGDAFQRSRKPLVAAFRFDGARITLINTHLTSRRGGDPLFGAVQPPEVGGASARAAQAREVRDFLLEALAQNPHRLFVVLGDMNEFGFGEPLAQLVGDEGPLEMLDGNLAPPERYSTIYEGNSQQLDHILASPALARHAELEIVHLNAEFPGSPSDHDPVLARFDLSWVPEPSSPLLAFTGALLLGGLKRWSR